MILSGTFASVVYKAVQTWLEIAAESFYLNINGDSPKVSIHEKWSEIITKMDSTSENNITDAAEARSSTKRKAEVLESDNSSSTDNQGDSD